VQQPACAKADRSVESFDAERWAVTPPAKETFWKVLQHCGVRFTEVSNPTQCPIHDSGPVDEAALAVVVEELTALCKLPGSTANTRRRKALVTEQRALTKAVDHYHLHLRQYEKQRAKVQQLEANLVPGEGLLYRDFVNDHDESGAKVCNLMLVLAERKVLGGPLVLTNIENFADKESCDAWFTADVFDFHLAPGDDHHSGLLDHLNKLYIVGDHGPHFSANNTLLNESTFFRRYKKVVECLFLCSYHAYNRCDAAGVVAKRLAAHEKRQSKGPMGAAAYAELVNSSSYDNHVAFAFPAINRSADVFPAEVEKLPHARQCCDVLYHRTRVDGTAAREEGVVWFRMVSDLALPYQLHDLLPREGKYMCVQCSNTTQEPVFHTKASECPRATMPVDLAQQRAVLVSPDPARIQGAQLTKKRNVADAGQAARPKRAKCSSDAKLGAFPCKFAFCDKLHFKTAGGSNRHMAGEHALEALQLYSDERKSKSDPRDLSMAAPSGQGTQASSRSSSPAAAQTESVPPEPAPVLRPSARRRAGRSLRDSGSSASSSSASSKSSESEDSISESSDQSEVEWGSRRLRAEPPVATPAELESAPQGKQTRDWLLSGQLLYVRVAVGPRVSTAFVQSALCLCSAGLNPQTPYEQERARNIARNKAELAAMGLGPGGPALLSAPLASRRGRPARGLRADLVSEHAAAPSAPARRSSRLAGLAGLGDTSTQVEASSVLAGAAAASDQLAAPSVAALQQLAAYRPPLEEVAPEPVVGAVPTPEAPGIATPAPTLGQEAAALLQQMAGGLLCGVCQGDIKASDARLECTSLRPNCEREYHHACVLDQFGHLYCNKEVAVPQPQNSKWRCMVCSDMCAVCTPATKIVANQPFYRCGFCGAKAHQRHWHAGDVMICVYCRVSM